MSAASAPLAPDQPRFLVSGIAATALAAILAAFYVYLQYAQNPNDLQNPRVQFWIGFTAAGAVAAVVGSIVPIRLARISLFSVTLWTSLAAVLVGIASIGILYVLPLGAAWFALSRTLRKRIELSDALSCGALFALVVWVMIEGLTHT